MIEDDITHIRESLGERPIFREALALLAEKLPKELSYHAYSHTEDVLSETLRFALTDQLPSRDIELLALAATFHDLGFIKSPVLNEPIGAAAAKEAMVKDGGYSAEEIALVERMILDTALVDTGNGPRQIPSTDLSRYLLDADLSNFGRDDFFDKGELQRQELGADQEIFRRNSLSLLNSHRWLTNAARSLRQKKKEQNLALLKSMVHSQSESSTISFDRLGFLAKLPLLLNSGLNTQKVITVALGELKSRLNAQAATIFLVDEGGETLSFWALQGSENTRLSSRKIPSSVGIVGWVIKNQEAIIVHDAASDPRFFSQIDKEAGFSTKSMICAPLSVREHSKVGAVQVLNKNEGRFTPEDREFVVQFSHQVALAIENAQLYEAVTKRSEQLELADSRKNELMELLAAEFKDPVSVIGSSAALLGSGALNDGLAVEKTCHSLAASVQRISKLIADFRNLAFATEKNIQITRACSAVQQIFRHVLDDFESIFKDRALKVSIDCPNTVGACEGDFNLLSIAIANLVSNAIRFTPNGGTIHLRGSRVDGFVIIEVSDSGIGMTKLEVSDGFGPLRTAAEVSGRQVTSYEFNSRGLGLGLPAVKSILHAHGTILEVKTSQGTGTSFTFSLPGA